MENKLKIFIVDDHDMFRAGVKVLLSKSQKTEIIGEASNGKEFIDNIGKYDPDVVLMDISMPVCDGIEATRLATEKNPELKILALSMFGEEEYYYKMIQSGVRGFVMKSAGINELEHAIQQVASGSAYFSNDLLNYVRKNISEPIENVNSDKLNDKEIAVLKAIAQNLTDEEIADSVKETVPNVDAIRNQLLKKCKSINSSGLVMYAIKQKIIKL